MPIKYRKVSSGADLHPYMKKGFVFPKTDQPAPLKDSVEERREFLRLHKRERTFFLYPKNLLPIGIKDDVENFLIEKKDLFRNKEFIYHIPIISLQMLHLLPEEEIEFVRINGDEWLAQTTFITKNT